MNRNKFHASLIINATQPVDQRLIVDSTSDLLAIQFKYTNMIVFVRADKRYYYLNDGVLGDLLTHWTVYESEGKFKLWVVGESYDRGDMVYVGGSGKAFFIAITANSGLAPASNPDEWLLVGGSVVSVELDWTINDNTFVTNATDRFQEIDFSELGGLFPTVETWVNIYDVGEGRAIPVKMTPKYRLNTDVNGNNAPFTMQIEFVGDYSELTSSNVDTKLLTGKTTIR